MNRRNIQIKVMIQDRIMDLQHWKLFSLELSSQNQSDDDLANLYRQH